MEGVWENILLVKDLLAHWKLCHQLYSLKYLVLFTVHNRIITFFLNLLHPNRSRIDISASPRFIKRADKGAQTYPCFQKQDSPAHSQQISLLPHSSGLYLPTPLRYNGFGPFSPQPVIVSVGCNGLLTGLGWGNFVAGLYSEVPNLPLRKKGSSRCRKASY